MTAARGPTPPAPVAPVIASDPIDTVTGSRPLPATDASGAGIADAGAGAEEDRQIKSEAGASDLAPSGAARPQPAVAAQPGDQPTLFQTAASAAAAMFGVQSSKNRERDFKARSPERFIIMGAVMTCLLVLVLLFAVRCAMLDAGYGQPESRPSSGSTATP